MAIYRRLFYALLPESSEIWFLPVGFIFAFVVSFLIYKQLIKILMKKMDMNKYFDPIFKARR
jgi:undecaprenyl pyrophosphate phosphatase UppP